MSPRALMCFEANVPYLIYRVRFAGSVLACSAPAGAVNGVVGMRKEPHSWNSNGQVLIRKIWLGIGYRGAGKCSGHLGSLSGQKSGQEHGI